MKRIALFLFLILSAITCLAQTQIDPTYQIAWNLLTGSGAPSISCTQNGNYTVYPYGAEWGQSYQDTTNNVEYRCTASGWIATTGGIGGTISAPYIPVATGTNAVGNSIAQQNASTISVGGSLATQINSGGPYFYADQYGAAGSGYATTGSVNVGTNPNLLVVASASGFAVNQLYTIPGAGVAGANLVVRVTNVSGTNITFTPSASTTVSGVAIDDTLGVQAAFNACYNGGAAGARGGTVVLPGPHTYLFNTGIYAYDACKIYGGGPPDGVIRGAGAGPPDLRFTSGVSIGTATPFTAFTGAANTTYFPAYSPINKPLGQVTVTATNTFAVNQWVIFQGCSTLAGQELNNQVGQVVAASGSSFTVVGNNMPTNGTITDNCTATSTPVLIATDAIARNEQDITNLLLEGVGINIYEGDRLDSGSHVDNVWFGGTNIFFALYFSEGALDFDMGRGTRFNSPSILSQIYWQNAGGGEIKLNTLSFSMGSLTGGSSIMIDSLGCNSVGGTTRLFLDNSTLEADTSYQSGFGGITLLACPTVWNYPQLILTLADSGVACGTNAAGTNCSLLTVTPANDSAVYIQGTNALLDISSGAQTLPSIVGVPGAVRGKGTGTAGWGLNYTYAPSSGGAGASSENGASQSIADQYINDEFQHGVYASPLMFSDTAFAALPNATTLVAGQVLAPPTSWNPGSSANVRLALDRVYQAGTTGSPNYGATTCTGVGGTLTCSGPSATISSTSCSANLLTVTTSTNTFAANEQIWLVGTQEPLLNGYNGTGGLFISSAATGTSVSFPYVCGSFAGNASDTGTAVVSSTVDLEAGQHVSGTGQFTNYIIGKINALNPASVIVTLTANPASFSTPAALTYSAPILGSEIQLATKFASAPTTSGWSQGDIVQNSSATSSILGWVCTNSGGCSSAGQWTAIGSGGVTIQTNTTNNTSQTTLNMETSTANTVGLTVTPSNPSGGIEKWEVTGASYTGNAATATYATSAGTATDPTKLPLTGSTYTDAFTRTATLGHIESDVNTPSPTADFQSAYGGSSYLAAGFLGAVKMATANNDQTVAGIAGIVENSLSYGGPSNFSTGAGVFGECNNTGAGAACFGGLFSMVNTSGSATQMTGVEIEDNFATTGDTGHVLELQGSWGAVPTARPDAIKVDAPTGTGAYYSVVLNPSPGAAAVVVDAAPAAVGTSKPSMEYEADNYDSGGALRKSYAYADALGDWVLAPYSGYVQFPITGSVQCASFLSNGDITGAGFPCSSFNPNASNMLNGTQTIVPSTPIASALILEGDRLASVVHVQSANNATTGTSGSTFSSNVTAGNTIIAFCSNGGGAVNDSLSNTFTLVGTDHMGDTVYVATNIAGGADTVNCGVYYPQTADEYSGLATSSVVDTYTTTYTNTAGATLSIGPITTTVADLLVSYAGTASGSFGTAPTGYTLRQQNNRASQGTTIADTNGTVAAGSQSTTWNTSGTGGNDAQLFLIALKAGAGVNQSAPLQVNETPGGTAESGVTATALPYTVPQTYSSLPACTASTSDATHVPEGTMTSVSDSTTKSIGATIAGSGSNLVPAWCNGSNWIVIGSSALASGDIPNNAANTSGTAAGLSGTLPIANGGTNATSAVAGTIPNASSSSAATWTSSPTLGASGTLGSLAFGNATSGLLKLETATGAITSYTLQLPVAQPSGSNTFLSCTAASPAVCTWAAAGGGTPAYPLTITGGVSGGIVYGSSSTQLTVSPAGTANVLVKWGGAATAPENSSVTDNGTTVTTTDTGGVVAPQFVGSGTTPSAVSLPAGTGNIPALAANSAGFAAPTTGGTSYLFKMPGTITAGILHAAAPATGDNVNESALTSSAVSLTADVSGTLPIANGGTNATSAVAGTIPNASSSSAATWTSSPTLGASGTLGSLAFGNAISGLLTLETATGAITSYTLQLPVAQPSGSNTFLSCTAASPAVCTWAAAGGGSLPSGSIGQTLYNTTGSTTYAAASTILMPSGATIIQIQAGPTTNTTLNGSCASGAATCTVTSSTGYPANAYVLIGTAGSFDVEMASVSFSGTTMTFNSRGLCNAGTGTSHATGATVALIESGVYNSSATNGNCLTDIQVWQGGRILSTNIANLAGPTTTTGQIVMTPSGTSALEVPAMFIYGNSGASFGTDNIGVLLAGAWAVDFDGFTSAAPGTQATTSGTTTIAPTSPNWILTGTAATALATITAPTGTECAKTGGSCLLYLTGVGFTTVTSGNIGNVVTVGANKLEICQYIQANTKWYCQ